MSKRQQGKDDRPELPRPRLMLFGRVGMGFLRLFLTAELSITVRLSERLVKVLLILHNALEQDQGLEAQMRGWMTNQQIADAFSMGNKKGYTPQPEAIAAYRAQINRAIRAEIDRRVNEGTLERHEPPTMFETQRGLGVRLLRQIDLDDLSARPALLPRGPDEPRS